MIDFPNTPANGAMHTEGGKTWQFNGTAWVGIGSTAVAWDNVIAKPAFGSAAYTDSSSYASSTHAHSLSDLEQGGASAGQVIAWSGTAWAPATASGGGNDLDQMFNSARSAYYHEINYTTGGDVSSIQVYATSAKTTHLYSRVFTYSANGNLTQIVTTDEQNNAVSLTKTIAYNGSGDISTVTRNYAL